MDRSLVTSAAPHGKFDRARLSSDALVNQFTIWSANDPLTRRAAARLAKSNRPHSAKSQLERARAAAYRPPMQLSEMLPALHQLPRADKFRAVQFLTTELAQEEGGLAPGAEHPVWSPSEAHEAAATLTQYLREQTGPH